VSVWAHWAVTIAVLQLRLLSGIVRKCCSSSQGSGMCNTQHSACENDPAGRSYACLQRHRLNPLVAHPCNVYTSDFLHVP
jgi:hypothetical protein